MNETELSTVQKLLLATDGTVTDLIAIYAGEQIHVNKLQQEIRRETAPAELSCPELPNEAPARLLHRRILLAGERRNYLYAESVFVFDRFSRATQEKLQNTDRPIGLLWQEERLETFKEVVRKGFEPGGEISQYFGLSATDRFVSRTYLIHHGGKPLGAITEKWPATLFRD